MQQRSFNDHGQKAQVKNLFVKKTDQVRWYTNMRDGFEAATLAPQEYDWFVSVMETNWRPS